mgnify:CR=1 FL=1
MSDIAPKRGRIGLQHNTERVDEYESGIEPISDIVVLPKCWLGQEESETGSEGERG